MEFDVHENAFLSRERAPDWNTWSNFFFFFNLLPAFQNQIIPLLSSSLRLQHLSIKTIFPFPCPGSAFP